MIDTKINVKFFDHKETKRLKFYSILFFFLKFSFVDIFDYMKFI